MQMFLHSPSSIQQLMVAPTEAWLAPMVGRPGELLVDTRQGHTAPTALQNTPQPTETLQPILPLEAVWMRCRFPKLPRCCIRVTQKKGTGRATFEYPDQARKLLAEDGPLNRDLEPHNELGILLA